MSHAQLSQLTTPELRAILESLESACLAHSRYPDVLDSAIEKIRHVLVVRDAAVARLAQAAR